jgi:hypothetical protein
LTHPLGLEISFGEANEDHVARAQALLELQRAPLALHFREPVLIFLAALNLLPTSV